MITKMTKDQQELVSENVDMMHSFIDNKTDKDVIPVYLEDDFASDIALRFCNSVIKFDEARGFQLSTYCYGGFNMCYNNIKTRKKLSYQKNNFLPHDDVESILKKCCDDTEHIEEDSLCDIINKAKLSDRELAILESYYFNGNSMDAVGKEMDLSKERISQIIKKVLAKLRRIISSEKLSLADFYVRGDCG